jgi:hypothetical protein
MGEVIPFPKQEFTNMPGKDASELSPELKTFLEFCRRSLEEEARQRKIQIEKKYNE